MRYFITFLGKEVVIYKVKDLPLGDRPREKLLLRGAQNLTDAELLAILLRTGTKQKSVITMAQEIIKENDNLVGLSLKSADAFQKIKGIGKDKAATLAAAFEIGRRVGFQEKWKHTKPITSPEDIANIFSPILKDKMKEEFIVVCLNAANKIIKHEIISVGTLNSSVVHPREVFKLAIDNNSANIIIVHNHPSGNKEPSKEDVLITKKLVEGGKLLGIEVFDHIIIAGNDFTSFVEQRLM